MPVDPGKLVLMAQIVDTPVICLPGCARSPKLNGFDGLLQRSIARLPIGPSEVMRMGGRGLLKDIPSRPTPRPRAKEGQAAFPAHQAPARPTAVARVLLDDRHSRRLGATNKPPPNTRCPAMHRARLPQQSG